MTHLRKRIVGLAAVTLFPFLSWAQQVSLTGVITDRFSKSAIVGARVVIGGVVQGISGPGGDYRVDHLRDGDSITVVYAKASYGQKSETVSLKGPQTKKDVILWPDTTDNVSWVELADDLGSKATNLPDSSKSRVFAQAWAEIDSSGISPEAKAAAAQALAPAIPNVMAPEGLKAYSQVNSDSIGATETSLQQVLAGTAGMPEGRTVPPDVAADVAAKQVLEYEKTSNQPVNQKFYSDFGKVYGEPATSKLKSTVNMDRGQVATNAQTNVVGAISADAAGVAKNADQIQAAEQRFDNLTEWDIKKDVTINFATGKSNLSDDAKQQLAAVAKESQRMKGYIIEVKGFASTTGNAQQNQQLSQDRAENVEDFLHQQGVPLKNLVNTAAMGTTNPVGSNDTQLGQLQNQRVEVKVLVNRALETK